MSEKIRNKVWNIELVVEDIKKFPQTYNTILGPLCKDTTCQLILRRKLNKLFNRGIVFKTSIPGTRFGKTIWFHMPKKYNIIFEGTRVGSNTFCFFKYKKVGNFRIRLDEYWQLEKGKWVKKNDKIIFEGNVLKWL